MKNSEKAGSNSLTSATTDSEGENKVIKPREEDENVSDGPPWLVFVIFLAGALSLPVFYGWSVLSATLLIVELLIGAASICVGGLLGFLFGMPRAPVGNGENEGEQAGSPNYRPSNNLEQISDWLTKILIGVGLVELRQVGTALAATGAIVAGTLKDAPSGASAVTQAVIVLFAIFGFVISFLWTRIYYGPLQTMTDQNLINRLMGNVKRVENKLSDQATATKNVEKVTKLLAKGNLVTLNTTSQKNVPVLNSFESKETALLPKDLSEKITEFQTMEEDWNSDPAKKLFPNAPQEKNGKRFEAKIIAEFKDYLVINLEVLNVGNSLFTGEEVIFLLHPTFDESIMYTKPKAESATVKIYAEGWFTAVAILDHGKTILSYNLRNLPNAPDWFKEN